MTENGIGETATSQDWIRDLLEFMLMLLDEANLNGTVIIKGQDENHYGTRSMDGLCIETREMINWEKIAEQIKQHGVQGESAST